MTSRPTAAAVVVAATRGRATDTARTARAAPVQAVRARGVYAGLHLTRHPPLAAYLLVGLPAVALVWRNRWPVGVFALTVAGAVAWAVFGQIDGAALVPVIVALGGRHAQS